MTLENVADIRGLGPVQEGMLFHTIDAPASGIGVEQVSVTIDGPLDTRALRAAWDAVLERHDSLRAIFLWENLDEPVQVIRDKVVLPWSELDWTDRSIADQATAFEHLVAQDRVQGHALDAAPLMRLTLIRLSPTKTQMLWSTHHILLDGWSVQIVMRDMWDHYSRRGQVDWATPYSYADWLEYGETQDHEQAERYWQETLAGFDAPTNIHDRFANGAGSTRISRHLTQDLSNGLRQLAQSQRATLNTVLLSAWAILVGHYVNHNDVVFGATSSGRPSSLDGIDEAVGLFINTLPVRANWSAETDTPATLIARLQEQQVTARSYDFSHLRDVQTASSVPPGVALFDSIVVFENYPTQHTPDHVIRLREQGIALSPYEFDEQSNYGLALLVVPGDEIEMMLVFDQAKYRPDFVDHMLSHLERICTALLASPDLPIAQLDINAVSPLRGPMLDDPLRAHALHELILRHVTDTPAHIAVAGDGVQLRFDQLELRARAVAQQLLQNGLTSGEPVVLAVGRGPDVAIGLLGILMAGGAFVPIDPDYPAERNADIIEDAQIRLAVTEPELCSSLPDHITRVFTAGTNVDDTPLPKVAADQLAYLLYTSGSQGRPKGVCISHANIVTSTLARRQTYSIPPKAFLLLSSVAFDSALVGLLWTLVEGGTLVIPPPKLEQDVQEICHWVRDFSVSHTLCIPTLYGLLLTHGKLDHLASLTCVTLAGEACRPAIVDRHFRTLPDVALFNEYGPTEAAIWCAAAQLSRDHTTASVPIGRPIAGTSLSIRDANLRIMPVGATGELCISGPGVARGYHQRPEQTAQAFVQDPWHPTKDALYRSGDLAVIGADEQVYYLGRRDDQVKIRGFRIELSEVETALAMLTGVTDVAAIVVQSGLDGHDDQILARALDQMLPEQAHKLLSDVQNMGPADIHMALNNEAPR